MKLVLCECPKCLTYTRPDENGNSTNGQMVDISTQRKHWAQSTTEPKEVTIQRMFPHLSISSPSTNDTKLRSEDLSSDESDKSPNVSTHREANEEMKWM
ncbi:hypothetical protein CROQUDRAFT_663273 [Cronartium quercuum f. sp. fusiforme G11]|uniref:Uncharacterized protein n=1 Tax=Cronartium quercuum f. sp. fusiforme G11 TaxID=708437 RepID=A0A9P6N8H0_9BASI|nr:hypothetical protein CROQUDRAFT_663273 [Cronartium quercuum f. sp. fusiforme G11]